MDEVKSPLQSRSVWGLAAAVLLTALDGSGLVHFDDEQMTAIASTAEQVATLVSLGIATYGTFKRKKRLSITAPLFTGNRQKD